MTAIRQCRRSIHRNPGEFHHLAPFRGFVGDKLADKIPMKLVHSIAAAIFALLGVATLLGIGAKLGL